MVPEYIMVQKIRCSHCKSENIIKWTKRKTENRGLIQRYKCNDCSRTFTLNDGFFRMRNAPQKITLCLDLFYRGISTRKVQEHLQSFYPHNSSWVSIYSWIIKYAKQISNFTSNLKLSVGKEMQIDEVEYNRRKSSKRKGIEKNWFIDSIDTETKFMVSSDFVRNREQKQLKRVLEKAKEKTGEQIKIITSDGYMAYNRAVKSSFGYYRFQRGEVEHNVITASKGDGFNYPIERLHNNLRSRTKTFRGFHGSVESANAIMKGWEIYYNFITKHQTLNCCPYQLAIPTLQLNPENKWLQLIKLATINN